METITVAVDERKLERVKILAKEAGKPLGDFIRELVLRKVAEHEQARGETPKADTDPTTVAPENRATISIKVKKGE